MNTKIKSMLTPILLSSLIVLPTSSRADVTVKYKLSKGSRTVIQVIKYASSGKVRQDIYNGKELSGSMLKKGHDIYMIHDGRAVNLSTAMGGMGGALAGMFGSKHKSAPKPNFKATGKYETIAGIKGELYLVQDNGQSHEVVLTDDKNLNEAYQASLELAKTFTSKLGFQSIVSGKNNNKKLKHQAILRIDQMMVLQEINNKKISADVFEVPGS